MSSDTPTKSRTRSGRWVIVASSSVALLLALYGCAPAFLGIAPQSKWIAFFPPFSRSQVSLSLDHLGAEYWNIACSLYRGEGFASPFGIPSGPTAWMPPALSVIEAAMLVATGGSRAATTVLFVALNALVFVGIARDIARRALDIPSIPAWLIPIGIGLVFLANFRDNFQRTHDGTWLLFLMHLLITQSIAGSTDQGAAALPHRKWFLVRWGMLGGIVSLSSPAMLMAWLAMTTRWVVLALRSSHDLEKAKHPRQLQRVAWYLAAIAIAFAIQGPWLIRNYVVFHRFIPIKSNGLFELEQSLLRDDDGIVDFKGGLEHPFNTPSEAKKHAALGEMEYLRIRTENLRAGFWDHRVKYASDCSSRLIGALFYAVTLFPEEEDLGWTTVARILFAIPCTVFFASLFRSERLSESQRSVILLGAVYLLPYLLLSYYARYMVPLMGLRCLLLFWGIGRLLHFRIPPSQ